MTSSSTTSSRPGKGKRADLNEVQREAADVARAAEIAALHEQIGEQVEALATDPQWPSILDARAAQRNRLGGRLRRGAGA